MQTSAKIYENVLFKHLYNYVQSNNLINKKQSGFRPGDSTTNQLIDLVNEIQQSFHSKGALEVRPVFLDISKAFDKVRHDGLLFKFKQNGIDGYYLVVPVLSGRLLNQESLKDLSLDPVISNLYK